MRDSINLEELRKILSLTQRSEGSKGDLAWAKIRNGNKEKMAYDGSNGAPWRMPFFVRLNPYPVREKGSLA